MLELFLNYFVEDEVTEKEKRCQKECTKQVINDSNLHYLFENFGGKSFNNGIYRIHSFESGFKWTEIVKNGFPEFGKNILIFGYDWLGRQFGISLDRERQIIFFDVATNESFNIPNLDVFEFHNSELVEFEDDALAKIGFEKWRAVNEEQIGLDKCVGYIVPLFLGGRDEIDNYEICDMEVYWDLNLQLIQQIDKLPPGSNINKIGLS
ncbi:T6SS immunity protein Tdi1 domain-containing protein [Pedobacter rhizosphaerae]|uniref:Uncharacterized protein n=1 Tax=Pedobacter rhizosphaerae TaxID=390241 RepID=A0A1H9R508_9SPHI|nr:T6SS immunity protein Tdi1 domain-containing protein [Pedobacter rhizosphaerae]SER67139.1 protein of unknown function [Pedobacter rhizosphaerae]